MKHPLKETWSSKHHFSRATADITILISTARAPSMITSQSVCEVSTPQRVRLSPPLLQGDEIPTPGLAMSPPTPRTISSQAPVTPVNQFFGTPFSSFRSSENVLESSDSTSLSNREFDPTALFVGGLETLGPSAWTQEKVEALFGRFRGLLHVKFVCPCECPPEMIIMVPLPETL